MSELAWGFGVLTRRRVPPWPPWQVEAVDAAVDGAVEWEVRHEDAVLRLTALRVLAVLLAVDGAGDDARRLGF